MRRTPNLPRQRRSKNGMSRLVQKCLPVSVCLCVHDFLGLMMFSEPLVSKRLTSTPPRRSLIDHQPHIIKWNSMGEKVGRTQQNRPRGCVVRQPAARFGQQKDFKVCVCVCFRKCTTTKNLRRLRTDGRRRSMTGGMSARRKNPKANTHGRRRRGPALKVYNFAAAEMQ